MKPFHTSQVDWEKIFSQSGGRFVGCQRGGSFGKLFRYAYNIVPALPDMAQAPVAKELVEQTTNVVKDIAEGANPLSSLKRRGRHAVNSSVGLGKKRVIHKKKTSKKRPVFLPAL